MQVIVKPLSDSYVTYVYSCAFSTCSDSSAMPRMAGLAALQVGRLLTRCCSLEVHLFF